ncbi:chemotaxis protein CheD [Fusobacterium sp. MFO224]|uniref:chemotaxis protein CheD n=1 Tax=Fusobacterium sp. MFO224 TaxID=3378070 RepID=UPI003851C4B7
MKKYMVSIGQIKIGTEDDELCAIGLGSCVAVIIYDSFNKIAGMIHILLPTVLQKDAADIIPTRYADTGIKILLDKVIENGAKKSLLRAKIVGGAELFSINSKLLKSDVGKRNVIMSKKTLEKLSIPLIASDVGGNSGRSATFYVNNNKLRIKTLKKGEKVI